MRHVPSAFFCLHRPALARDHLCHLVLNGLLYCEGKHKNTLPRSRGRRCTMNSTSLVQIALCVLTAWTDARDPNAQDLAVLYDHAFPHERTLPPDALACLIVERECAIVSAQ